MNISFGGSVLPLLTFNTKYSKNGLVQTQVKRNGGAATLQHAFAASIYGPIAIFERQGKSRFPVEQKYGPSTGHMMQNDKVIEQMSQTIQNTYDSRIEHEILRVLNGYLLINSVRQTVWRVDALEDATVQEVGTVALSNSLKFPFNNSQQSVALEAKRDNLNYIVVIVNIAGEGNVGEVEVTDRLENGFKISYTGSASSATITYAVIGGYER